MACSKNILVALIVISVWVISLWPGAAVADEILSGRASALSGDTLSLGGARVRLFDVKALPVEQTCMEWRGARQVDYACGQYAHAFLASVVADKTVSCVPRDSHDGDVVATCFVEGVDLGEALVSAGWAVTCGTTGRYVLREEAARSARRGLWIGNFKEQRVCYGTAPE